jgi:hypothetical protein
MFFQCRNGLYCQFLEEDLKTPLPRKITFATEDKVPEMAKLGGANMSLDTIQAMEHAIENGRGGVWLEVTEEQ